MHKDNIKNIMKSNLWKKIIRNKNYIGYKVVDTKGAGYFHMIMVFFDMDVSDNLLEKYLDEGRRITKGEMLDDNPILKVYGRVRIITFS